MEKNKYNLEEVAKEFDVSRRTVERWIKAREIDSIKIGHTRRVTRDEIEKKSGISRHLPTK